MFAPLIQTLSRFFAIRPGEAYRVGIMASLLFLLLAANNLIKILRDSIFLGHHPVSELPYLYVLVAVFAGVIISIYTRYTVHLSLVRLIPATNALVILMTAGFWFLLTYIDPVWSHYAFYIWSAMVSVIAVAQLWTLANQIFSPDEGKRLFGILAAGGTVGGAAAGFGAKWTMHLFIENNHLLWVIAGLYLAASALVLGAERRLTGACSEREFKIAKKPEEDAVSSVSELLGGSRYLKTIAVVILASVIVSTLIDFQFKTAAKQAYPSRGELAGFFSSYYGWLSVASFFTQVVLTGKTLNTLGLRSSLYLTPGTLLAGALAVMIWPTLVAAALTRMADATLRNSIHRSGMEILYMALPARVMRTVKSFLDVVLERVGDAIAGFVILLFSLSLMASYITYLHFVCVALIFMWIVLIQFLRSGYAEAIRTGLISDEPSPEEEWLATNRIKRSLGD